MLIECFRHTQADLDYWKEIERADIAHGSHIVRGKSEFAIQTIRNFVSSGPAYCATSWGRDSTVVCHLLVMSGVRIPAVFIVQLGPQQDPYQTAVRDAFLRRFDLDYREIEVEPLHKTQRDASHTPQLDFGIKRAAKEFGTRRWIGGLRAAESGARKIRARMGSEHSCWPIGWWSDADVFGWLAVNDLPVHPAYGMTGGGLWDRNRIRVSIIGGKKGRGGGRAEWEREYYGDILRRLEAGR